MKDERGKTLNHWGVRLIGCYFFILAVSDVYKLITGTRHTKGFMGIDLGITHNGESIDVMAWIGVYILFYTGFQLMRFYGRGRTWALIMLWPSTIFLGALFVASIISVFSPPVYKSLSSSFSMSWPWCQCRAETPLEILSFLGLAFAYYLIPLYFLLRTNTKVLFRKAVPTGETN